MRANVWKELENYFLILLGTALMAIAIQWILEKIISGKRALQPFCFRCGFI